nr:DMATS-type prenyltransferase StrI [Stachybotrys sp.]
MSIWQEISAYRHTLSSLEKTNYEISSEREDQAFWWNSLSPSLAALLEKNKYPEEEQQYYLRWFHTWIAPALGVRPRYGKPYYTSGLTHDKSPLEFSQNWKENSPDQLVRFTLEPASRESGTASDPFNQKIAKDVITRMSKHVPGIDLKRFEHFFQETSVPFEASDEIAAKLLPGQARARVLLAFDLDHGGPVAKAYFVPQLKATYTGVTQKQVVFDSIRKWSPSYIQAADALEGYLNTRTEEKPPQPFLVAIDCDDNPRSRVKVYLNETSVDTLNKAKEIFSLGGKLNSPTIKKSLEAIDEWWYHIFALEPGSQSDDKKVLFGPTAVYAFELRPSEEGQNEVEMEVKLHLPLWVLEQTDAQLSNRLSAWFKAHNHEVFADRYLPDLEYAFPKNSLNESAGTHTWVSITYTPKTGLYMTMYYTPRLPEVNGLWT